MHTEGRKEAISILLLEDDIDTCCEIENCIHHREDVCLVGKTNSSKEALILVKKYKPKAIIVDLELNEGYGTGFEFLTQLRNMQMACNPLIIVNTNVKSPLIYNTLHEGYADLIFCKKQPDYSIEYILNAIVFQGKRFLKEESNNNITGIKKVGTLREEEHKHMERLITTELDKIGISPKLKGREYIFYALVYMLSESPKKFREVSPLQHVASMYGMFPSSISRGIQTAINTAWNKTPIEDIEACYQAKFSLDTGVPTAMEFIFYYYHKIKEQL